MPKTNKTQIGDMTCWIEYANAWQTRPGAWASDGTGFIRFSARGNKKSVTLETSKKMAYGRTAEQAEDGARKRAQKILDRTTKFFTEDDKET